jgi:hypothetical protein
MMLIEYEVNSAYVNRGIEYCAKTRGDNVKGDTDFNLRHGNQGLHSQQQLPYIASGFGKTALFELLFRSL